MTPENDRIESPAHGQGFSNGLIAAPMGALPILCLLTLLYSLELFFASLLATVGFVVLTLGISFRNWIMILTGSAALSGGIYWISKVL
ncbi:MAG: hypothetical protein AAF226_07020 [Verrucomicrobiota bacterium]